MNVFVLDKNPIRCAEYHCDKHVVKMILETAQLLCSAVIMCGGDAPYKLTHRNHPCAIWARGIRGNWLWLQYLGLELCDQYTKRYNKEHKCEKIISSLDPPDIPNRIVRFDVQAMPDQYKCDDIVQAYRNYYMGEKRHFAKWDKLGNVPHWWK